MSVRTSRGAPCAKAIVSWLVGAAAASIGATSAMAEDGNPTPVRIVDSCPRNPWVSGQASLSGASLDSVSDMKMVDLDGDGRDEIVLMAGWQSQQLIVAGAAAGRFGLPRAVPLDVRFGRLTIADLNGDGRADVLVHGSIQAEPGQMRLSAFLNDGHGTLDPAWTQQNAEVISQIAVRRGPGGTRSILVPAGSEGLREIVLDETGHPATDVLLSSANVSHAVLVDLDDDGLVDLLVGRAGFLGGWSVRRGQPDGTWGDPEVRLIDVGLDSRIAVADVTGDGRPDLVTVPPLGGPGRLQILPGDGQGSFATPRTVGESLPDPLADAPFDVQDLDGDDVLDLVIGRRLPGDGGGLIEVYRGDGRGDFTLATWIPSQAGATLASGDLDGDGLVDLASAVSGFPSRQPIVVHFGQGGGTVGHQVAVLGARGDALPVPGQGAASDLLTVDGMTLRRERWTAANRLEVVTTAEVLGPSGTIIQTITPSPIAGGAALWLGPTDGSDAAWVVMVEATGDTIDLGPAIPIERGLRTQTIGDVDGDGRVDLVIGRPREGLVDEIEILSLATDPPTTLATWELLGSLRGLTVGDLDGDGTVDVVARTWGPASNESSLEIAWGRPRGGSPAGVDQVIPIGPSTAWDVLITDWDADGMPDAIVAPPRWHLVRGLGGRRFDVAEMLTVPPAFSPPSTTVFDIDGDGRRDLVLAGAGGWRQAAIGYGAGSDPAALEPRLVPGTPGWRRVTPADVDGDGHLDLVWAGSSMVGVTLARPCPDAACLGDLDADGSIDFEDLLALIGPIDTDLGELELIWDLDGDADRDSDDVVVLLGNWGRCVGE